ncbi:putative Nudix hydrolase YfcD [subsurface metagenome]
MVTTDNLEELFDIVDSDDNVVGRATRRECHADPALIHRAVFVLVFNDQGQVLWQERSLSKDVNPGQWVTSVSGHVNAGESYEEAAVRETREDLGVDLPVEFLGTFLYRYPAETEYSAVFRVVSPGPFAYNRDEVSSVAFMTVADILKREEDERLNLSPAAHYIIDSLSLY